MDGLDNENISVMELVKFAQKVGYGEAICPKCKKNKLKISDLQMNDNNTFNLDKYLKGRQELYVHFKVLCDCGFENEFDFDWCRKGDDGERRFYKVCHKVGGVPEKPDFTYEDIEQIYAYSERDAIKIYDEKNGRSYWSTVIYPYG